MKLRARTVWKEFEAHRSLILEGSKMLGRFSGKYGSRVNLVFHVWNSKWWAEGRSLLKSLHGLRVIWGPYGPGGAGKWLWRNWVPIPLRPNVAKKGVEGIPDALSDPASQPSYKFWHTQTDMCHKVGTSLSLPLRIHQALRFPKRLLK